jgi:hypothetical protein
MVEDHKGFVTGCKRNYFDEDGFDTHHKKNMEKSLEVIRKWLRQSRLKINDTK